MNKIYLPDIKSIHLKNYSLYPGGLDFKYEFVHGVNLIVGGNGMGKTTFVNLLRFGMIGLYKKDFGFTRTYLGRKIEKRKELPSNYFYNRMDSDIEESRKPELEISFELNNTIFIIKRDIQNFVLKEVRLIENSKEDILDGDIILQGKYESLSPEEQKKYLQYKYEKEVANKANLFSFDDFIFLINEILFFGEDRKIILWDEKEEEIQERLVSKYFNDPELDNKREEALRQAQYFDSLSRHKSVDISTLNKVIKSIDYDTKEDKEFKKSVERITKLKTNIDRKLNRFEHVHKTRQKVGDEQRILRSSKNKLNIEIGELEKEIDELNLELVEDTWIRLNPKYQVYRSDIIKNVHCPMCSQALQNQIIREIANQNESCFLCDQKIRKQKKNSPELSNKKKDLNVLLKSKQRIDSEIVKKEKSVEKLDSEYKKLNAELFELKRDVRNLEHSMNKGNDDEKSSYELKALLNEVDKLEIKKKEYAAKSKLQKGKAAKLTEKLEKQNIKITVRLSEIFSAFAEKFLGITAYLTYDDFKDGRGRRFVPVIGGKVRLHSEELSESQRFFIEHSYRMTLLNFFYEKPSFFICETPDSSLDISYERNAADIFLGYLKQPNSLILTTNLNNSEFMDYIIDKAPKIRIVNLFDIGKKSVIQEQSPQLRSLIEKLNKKVNAKRN